MDEWASRVKAHLYQCANGQQHTADHLQPLNILKFRAVFPLIFLKKHGSVNLFELFIYLSVLFIN